MFYVWLFIMCSATWAQQLQWEAEEQKFNPSPSDTVVAAYYKFKNLGNAEANITAVNSSCSCTKITLDKRNYAPGESGALLAIFTIGDRTGVQDKVILVETNDTAKPRAVLRMKVTIPEIAQLRPSFVFWNAGESAAPKTVSLKIEEGVPVNSVVVESSDPAVLAKAEVVATGQEYRIVVTPQNTQNPITATLTIKTDYPLENPKKFTAVVRVLPAR